MYTFVYKKKTLRTRQVSLLHRQRHSVVVPACLLPAAHTGVIPGRVAPARPLSAPAPGSGSLRVRVPGSSSGAGHPPLRPLCPVGCAGPAVRNGRCWSPGEVLAQGRVAGLLSGTSLATTEAEIRKKLFPAKAASHCRAHACGLLGFGGPLSPAGRNRVRLLLLVVSLGFKMLSFLLGARGGSILAGLVWLPLPLCWWLGRTRSDARR